jgi:23S rRNA (uracil1939-C5)-methyltransferase
MAGGVLNARAKTRPSATIETADVVDLSHEGRGIAHIEGKATFIDDALPGERVEWRRMKRTRNFDEGRLERVLVPSPDRVAPQCAHFGVCGGCVLQHLSSDKQLAFKEQQLFDSLERIGRVSPQTKLPALQADIWHYRRRARLAARWVPKKQKTVVGFRERSTTYIADLTTCEVLTAEVAALIEPLSQLITALSVRDRVPQIEVAHADTAIALVVRVLSPLTDADRALLLEFASTHKVELYVQPGGYDTVAKLAGEPAALSYRLPAFDVSIAFQPTDFIQINARLNERMIDRALELLAPQADEDVLDLFCGLGNFSLPLARRARRVVGVEGESGLVERARQNARMNGIENAQFFTANLAAEDLRMLPWAQRGYAKVLLDPPRAGAREALPVVAASGAQRVVYVSCHPGSLARDAGLLVHEHGFELQAAGVMDMFPHTAHVESIAVFERVGSRKGAPPPLALPRGAGEGG